MKNTNIQVEVSTSDMLDRDRGAVCIKLTPSTGATYAAPNKSTAFLKGFRSPLTKSYQKLKLCFQRKTMSPNVLNRKSGQQACLRLFIVSQ